MTFWFSALHQWWDLTIATTVLNPVSYVSKSIWESLIFRQKVIGRDAQESIRKLLEDARRNSNR